MDEYLNRYLSGYYDGRGVGLEVENETVELNIVLFMRLLDTDLGKYLSHISTGEFGNVMHGEPVCQFNIDNSNRFMSLLLKSFSKYTLLNGQVMYNLYNGYMAGDYTFPNLWDEKDKDITERSRRPGIAYFAGLFDAMGQVNDDSIVISFDTNLRYIEYLYNVLIQDFGIITEVVVNGGEFDLEIKFSDTVSMQHFLDNIYPFTFYGKLDGLNQ